VDGFKDIHESLEATTAQGEIETLTEGVQSRSCQEVSLFVPSVLTTLGYYSLGPESYDRDI